MGFLIVFLGGGIGAALRHGVNLVSARLLGTGFNYATLFENVTGSVIMGLLVGYCLLDAGEHRATEVARPAAVLTRWRGGVGVGE